jgi:hypothetical protein
MPEKQGRDYDDLRLDMRFETGDSAIQEISGNLQYTPKSKWIPSS